MVESYIRQCVAAGLAYDSIRLRLVPVKSAWRRMHADYPELVKAPAALKLAPPARREIECLDAGELARLLDWLKVHKPDLWPMACLPGLAGLRVLETAALRVQDVDLDAGTVTVTKTDHHIPKNQASYRTIPVCSEVLGALREAIGGQKVRPTTGELFTNRAGNHWTVNLLSQRWRYTLRRAALALDMPRLAMIPSRKLRASFATMTGRMGAQDRLVKACLGHSSGDMLGGHYRKIELDELRTVSGVMNDWRKVLTTESLRKDSGNIPDFALTND
jgi:integrase